LRGLRARSPWGPVPFPALLRGGNGNGDPDPRISLDPACVPELVEHGAEALVADAELSAEVGASTWSFDERVEDVRGEVPIGCSVTVLFATKLEVHVAGGVVSGEGEVERVWGGRRAMFDAQDERVTLAPEIERRIDPRMEIARPTEGLPEDGAATVLAGVMDDDDGEVVLALEFA